MLPVTPAAAKAAIAASQKDARRKINKLYAAEITMHTTIADALKRAKNAVTEYKIEELRGMVNHLAKERPFSVGRFMGDLMVSITLGPVLGTLVGHFLAGRVSSMVQTRAALKDLTRTIRGSKVGKALTPDDLKDLQKGFVKEFDLALSKRRSPTGLSDLQTSIVVDTFQQIGGSLAPLVTADISDQITAYTHITDNVVKDPTQNLKDHIKITAESHDVSSTVLDSIDENAEAYLRAHRKITYDQRTVLEMHAILADTSEELTRLHDYLDRALEKFQDAEALTRYEEEMRNISRMIGLLLFKGNPKDWGKVRGLEKSTYQIAWPPELQLMVLDTLWVPGLPKRKSFLNFYRAQKQVQLERVKGSGITERDDRPHYGHSPEYPSKENSYAPGNLLNPRFTAQETAFYYFQKFMQRLYDELSAGHYESEYRAILERYVKRP